MILLVKKGKGIKKEIVFKSYLVAFILNDKTLDFIKYLIVSFRDNYLNVEAYCEDEHSREYVILGFNTDEIPVNIMELSRVLRVSPLKGSINRKVLGFILKEKEITIQPADEASVFITSNLYFLKVSEGSYSKYVLNLISMDSVFDSVSFLLKFRHPLTKIILMSESLKNKTSMTNIILDAVEPWVYNK